MLSTLICSPVNLDPEPGRGQPPIVCSLTHSRPCPPIPWLDLPALLCLLLTATTPTTSSFSLSSCQLANLLLLLPSIIYSPRPLPALNLFSSSCCRLWYSRPVNSRRRSSLLPGDVITKKKRLIHIRSIRPPTCFSLAHQHSSSRNRLISHD